MTGSLRGDGHFQHGGGARPINAHLFTTASRPRGMVAMASLPDARLPAVPVRQRREFPARSPFSRRG